MFQLRKCFTRETVLNSYLNSHVKGVLIAAPTFVARNYVMELVRFLMLYHGISTLACHLFLGSKSGAKIIS